MSQATCRLVVVCIVAKLSLFTLAQDACAVQRGEALLQIDGGWDEAGGGKSLSQRLDFANEAVTYGLKYDISMPADLPPNRCVAQSSVFRSGHVPLGMTWQFRT